uniref:Uncharacterized protein n=1 Tax=Panagrolaimus sp. ES5 TaxID=591445 RepID=A0AC34GDJ6_9BILA
MSTNADDETNTEPAHPSSRLSLYVDVPAPQPSSDVQEHPNAPPLADEQPNQGIIVDGNSGSDEMSTNSDDETNAEPVHPLPRPLSEPNIPAPQLFQPVVHEHPNAPPPADETNFTEMVNNVHARFLQNCSNIAAASLNELNKMIVEFESKKKQ